VVGVSEASSHLFFGGFLIRKVFYSDSPLRFFTFAKISDERLGIFSPFSGEFFFDP
jgi:hypothetical protein